MSEELHRDLEAAVGRSRVSRQAPLAPLTTFRVGGSADWLVDVCDPEQVRQIVSLTRAAGVPLTVVGGGSNVLVADEGVRGVVARIRGGSITSPDPSHVRAEAGVTINGLVRWMITRGLGGLEAWAGTPGTVGGAIHGNAHFQGRLISETLERVTLVTPAGERLDVPARDLRFAYDYSRLHETGELVLNASFRATSGDPASLREVARASLAFRKRTQPLESASAGCIFQNPNLETDRVPAGIPRSAGALVDRAGLKGATVGRAMVSTRHANFIVNLGGASAADIRELIQRCKRAVYQQFGVTLREEIVYLGFGQTPGIDAARPQNFDHGDALD